MTLLVAAVAPNRVIFTADRRITGAEEFRSEDDTKFLVLDCVDARVIVGFAGTAHYRSADGTHRLSTLDWLLETIADIGKTIDWLNGIALTLGDRLTEEFRRIEDGVDKRLTVIIAGFAYAQDGTPVAGLRCISNHEAAMGEHEPDLDEFVMERGVALAPMVYLGGFVEPNLDVDGQSLVDHLANGADVGTVEMHARKIIQAYAHNPKSHGKVGNAVSSVILESDRDRRPTFMGDHPDVPADEFHARMAPTIVVRAGHEAAIAPDIQINFKFDAPTNRVATPISRNSPCGCGSGQKYKRCRGRNQNTKMETFLDNFHNSRDDQAGEQE